MSDEFAFVIQQLEQDANALRIKKLLLYVCKNWWENDATRLSVISLSSLIEEIWQTHLTVEHLRSRLTHLVGTLNKSAEYFPIAHTIASVLEILYTQKTSAIAVPKSPVPQDPIIEKLEQEVQLIRIKKLLICACRKYWEANPKVIEQIALKELIDDLIELHPTFDQLRSGLNTVVKTLNKPIEYFAVAEVILREVEVRYGKANEPQPISETVEGTTDLIDLFDIRLEILKYANPLQAKILLFSVAYYLFEFRNQDWLNLRLYSLDGLLRTVLSQTSSLEDLQQKLQSKAQYLSQSEQYVEIVPVIVKSLKSKYTLLQRQIQKIMQSSSVADMTCAGSTQLVTGQLGEVVSS
jgi:hypothetical protein